MFLLRFDNQVRLCYNSPMNNKKRFKNMLPAEKENPLGTKPLGKLLFSLAVPAVIANVVNALYNIVDQIFIGNGIGLEMPQQAWLSR